MALPAPLLGEVPAGPLLHPQVNGRPPRPAGRPPAVEDEGHGRRVDLKRLIANLPIAVAACATDHRGIVLDMPVAGAQRGLFRSDLARPLAILPSSAKPPRTRPHGFSIFWWNAVLSRG